MAEPTARFIIDNIIDNPDGWGPTEKGPDNLDDLLFKPFRKGDRLSHISDWNQQNNFPRRLQTFAEGQNSFNYNHEDDESSFNIVDNTPKPKTRRGRRKFQQPRRRFMRNRGRNNPANQSQRGGRALNPRRQSKRKTLFRRTGRRPNRYQQDEVVKEPSVQVEDDWKVVKEMDLGDFRVALTVKEGETLVTCGEIREFDTSYERVNPNHPVDLKFFDDVQVFTTTTSEDPVIRDLADRKEGNIFVTDTIAAVLMTVPDSKLSWDIIATKRNGLLYFDKRRNSKIDYLSVNENYKESKQTERDHNNHPENLSKEATFINHNFMNQILTGKRISMQKKNPFLDALQPPYKPAPIAYYYRRWSLGGGRTIIVRCELNGYEIRKGKREFFVSKAMNEWNSKLSGNIDYRSKLESQSGNVLATEMKNNRAKLAKWTTQALISGADQLKLGYVTRANVNLNNKHHVLLTEQYKPHAFANLMDINPLVLWGTLSKIVSAIQEQPDGTYLILRDPVEPKLHIHDIPENAFDHETGAEEDDVIEEE